MCLSGCPWKRVYLNLTPFIRYPALDHYQIQSSMSRTGDCWDNAVAESFFATLEFELIEQRVFDTRDQARSAIFEFIEVFYNRQRAHQTLDYRTPVQVEMEAQLVA